MTYNPFQRNFPRLKIILEKKKLENLALFIDC